MEHYYIKDDKTAVLVLIKTHIFDDFAPELELDMDKLKAEYNINPDLPANNYLPIIFDTHSLKVCLGAVKSLNRFIDLHLTSYSHIVPPTLTLPVVDTRWDMMQFSGDEVRTDVEHEVICPEGTLYAKARLKNSPIQAETDKIVLSDVADLLGMEG